MLRYLLLLALLLSLLAPSLALAQDQALVVLGLGQYDAPKFNVEFLRFDRMVPVYQENGIQASLMDNGGLYRLHWPEDQLYNLFRQYHAIHITTTEEGVPKLTPELIAQAKVAGAALARYVREGGGLFLQPQGVRYPTDQDEVYWNMVLEPLGCQILHEGAFDKTRQYEGKTLAPATFWYTNSVQPHPVTEGVECLYLPLHAYGPWAGVPALQYSPDWQVIVSGEPEAKSYKCGKPGNPNTLNLDTEGTYATAPPVVAVRQLGAGRIVCYPISPLFTGMNHSNPLWSETVETAGDPAAGRPSDSMKLQMNAYHWLAEPVLENPAFGTYRPEPYQPVEFPPSVDWDKAQFSAIPGLSYAPEGTPTVTPPAYGLRAIFGVHTALSDGQGSVADYVAAAQAAGLSVIVFAEPLESTTAVKLAQLKADCAAASQAGDFYACPGVEFTDGIGNRWAMWGEKIEFPDATFTDPYRPDREYNLWDGRRVLHYGHYAIRCGFSPSALLDHKQLRANGAHPENLWWFFDYFPLVYDHGKPVADNYSEFLYGLRDMRWSALASFTRITSPTEVAAAAQTLFTGFRDIPTAKAALNTRGAPYWAALAANQYVSQGPRVLYWNALNPQMESNWRYTRGAQRVRVRFAVQSDAGIREVRVHDADQGLFRRFAGNGEKVLARDFEMVQDQQHYLTLEVIDNDGRRAFSPYLLVYCYKQGLFRCGDNLNILGATGMIWHPDRMEMFPMAKGFHNGEFYTLQGWDRGGALCPMPQVRYEDFVYLQDLGPYPHTDTAPGMQGRQLDMGLSSYNLQTATMRMRNLSQRYDTAERPTPALATVAKDVGENEYFERTHTIYAPEDREDYYVIWNNRRLREGMQNYQGGIIWHEGEIRFKKDVTLTGNVPISLAFFEVPTDVDKGWGNSILTTDADGVTRVGTLPPDGETIRGAGRLRPGGYAALLPSLVGHLVFYSPPGSDFGYSYTLPGRLYIGLGRNGQQIKAGTVIPYRFAVATIATPDPSQGEGATDVAAELEGNGTIANLQRAMNLAGGMDGYPVKMTAGQAVDATFFFTAQAQDGEAAFALGPQEMIVDLPLRIQGLEDNGCVAVYSSLRPWFRFVPVHQGAAYFQESIEKADDLWVGNIFRCDQPGLKVTVIVDGQAPGRPPRIEVHNPGEAPVTTRLSSPPHTPVFAGMSATLTIPAGDTVRLVVEGEQLQPAG